MTPDDTTKALLLLAMFAGQALLLVLVSALQREDWPAPFWRFMERTYDTITWPIILAVEWTTDRFWDLYYRTPKGKREHEAAKALRVAAFHRELHPHCRCARTERP